MTRKKWSFVVLLLGLCACIRSGGGPDRRLRVEKIPTAAGGPRLALVIGNANYNQPLKNPLQDARAMAALLRELGFTVMEKTNLGLSQMERAIREFGDLLKNLQGVGLFYYAGHGVQVDGENYLIPVGERLEREDEVKSQAVNAGLVLSKMESARNGTNIVILDACRDNPFRSYWRSEQKGLATMNAPIGTFISYATAPGKVAGDGAGNNGVYTAHLLSEMRIAGSPIEQVFKRVRQRVFAETGGRQVPWDASSLQGEFYFTPPVPVEEPALPRPVAASPAVPPAVVAAPVVSPTAASAAGTPVSPPKAELQNRPVTPPPIGPLGSAVTQVVNPTFVPAASLHGSLPKTDLRGAMIMIPAATLVMGTSISEEEDPPDNDEQQHEVKLTRGFWLGQTEVTQAQWERVMGNNPSAHPGPDLPVEQISWFDAVTYCNRLSRAEKLAACYKVKSEKVDWLDSSGCLGYRLPTEAEWEHAARAGQKTRYPGSDDVDHVAWYSKNSNNETHPVGRLAANAWGLFDMGGNVWEWVWDFYGAYPAGNVTDPSGPRLGVKRVIRSGSWGGDSIQMRSAERGSSLPEERNRRVGFRLARSLP